MLAWPSSAETCDEQGDEEGDEQGDERSARLRCARSQLSETLTEALHRLGQAGFARRFERVGDMLRCASCEESFAPGELVVEEVDEVHDEGSGARATLYALRCCDCGAKGVWIVSDAGPEDRALLSQIGTSEASGRDPGSAGPTAPTFGT